MDKNAGSVFEQRKALARLRAHLRDSGAYVRAERPGIGVSAFPICPCSLSSPVLTAEQASGSIRLSQRRKRRIPWPAMLCYRRMLPSLHLRQQHQTARKSLQPADKPRSG
ncbi:hypothetical protein FD733_11735 [Pantoea sp. Eser]|nr:hypothetical protein [Pantoea sp. Eser]